MVRLVARLVLQTGMPPVQRLLWYNFERMFSGHLFKGILIILSILIASQHTFWF